MQRRRAVARSPQARPPKSFDALAHAQAVAEHLGVEPGVVGVGVFGSVARGSHYSSSDLDLLALVEATAPSTRALLARLPRALRTDRIVLRRYDRAHLSRLMHIESPFSTHLRRECQVLVDPTGALRSLLTAPPTRFVPVAKQVRRELARLDDFKDLDVFRGNYLYVLARVYAVAKAIAILSTWSSDTPMFDRRAAFAELSKSHPWAASDIRFLTSLEPFYLRVDRGCDATLPFPHEGSRKEVVRSLKAVSRVAAAFL